VKTCRVVTSKAGGDDAIGDLHIIVFLQW